MKTKKEDALYLDGQIDGTNFGTIRRYLYPTSPIRWLVFVNSEKLLVE